MTGQQPIAVSTQEAGKALQAPLRAQDHRLQLQRFELKYLIPESITGPLRDFVRSYLELDDYGVGHTSLAYPVHSLYLDSRDLSTYYAGVNGTKNRYKLRLRYYNDDAAAPVFFEVKRREDNCILKQRCPVRRQAIPALLAGQLPKPGDLLSQAPRHLAALQNFNRLLNHIGARPVLHNEYRREAWVSPHDNSVRVTFDRQIQAEPYSEPRPVIKMNRPKRVFQQYVVLELKFTTRFPNWLREMVRRFNLMQASSAKYCEGILAIGEHRFLSDL